MFVSHDLPAATFNSTKFAKAIEDIDGAVLVCIIQASKVIDAGYLLGSGKTINNSHLDLLFNNCPRLNKMDVKVSPQPIKGLTNGPWNPKHNVVSAHILYSPQEQERI